MASVLKFIKGHGIVCLALFLVISCAYIYYPLSGLTIVGAGDGMQWSAATFYPFSSLNDGIATWNKYLAGGIPTAVTGYSIWGLVFGALPLEWAVFFIYCISVTCGAYFLYLYLLEIGCRKSVSIVMALIYVFSIHIGGLRKAHMVIITAIVLLPPAIYTIQRYINTQRKRWIFFCALALAMGFYIGGHSQIVLYTCLATASYFILYSLLGGEKVLKTLAVTALLTVTAIGLSLLSLLPVVEVLYEYSKQGSSDVPFEYFSAYSMHPIKLIQMIFPELWQDEYQALNAMNTGEFNIEIYFGIALLLLAIFGIIRNRKEALTITLVSLCSLALVYICVAHIPLLAEVTHSMPIIGGFRCSSRAIFVFIFFAYILAARGMERLASTDEMMRFFRLQARATLTLALLAASSAITIAFLIGNGGIAQDRVVDIQNSFIPALASPVLVLSVMLVVVAILHSGRFNALVVKVRRSPLSVFNVFILLVLAITLLETAPYSMRMNPNMAVAGQDNASSRDAIISAIGDGRAFNSTQSIDEESIISMNRGMLNGVASINAYITYNNPVLYKMFYGDVDVPFNSTGLLREIANPEYTILERNDLLSMLGVTHIIDNGHVIPDNNLIPDISTEKLGDPEVVYRDVAIPESHTTTNQFSVWQDDFPVEPGEYYYVEIDFSVIDGSDTFFIDFYGTDYDFQYANTPIISGRGNQYEGLIYSGRDIEIPSDTYLRVVTVDSGDITIENLKVYKATSYTGKIYEATISDGSNRLFVNNNARDILYFSGQTKHIESLSQIYNNPTGLNLDKISYGIDLGDSDYETGHYAINDTVFRNDSISANVTADKAGFLNFSQCYFPGWSVYIDGQKRDVRIVNALIMGVEVPEGKHFVEFKYFSNSILLGAICSLATVVAWFIGLLLSKRRVRGAVFLSRNRGDKDRRDSHDVEVDMPQTATQTYEEEL
jgi:hypothetical protein